MNLTETPTLLRVSVSKAKEINWHGNIVETGIFKTPVEGKITVRRLNLDGDEQADLSVHGGPDKAVYAYPIEQYSYWSKEAPDKKFEWGSFGENLTLSGFDENTVCIGDTFRIGTVLLCVTQPRMPCYKLGIRLDDPNMIRRFYKSGKWGFYLSVIEGGELQTGDKVVQETKDSAGVTLAMVASCFLQPNIEAETISRVLKSKLAAQMKGQLQSQISR